MRCVIAAAIWIGMTLTASADGFDIAIPGHPGVPVLINGRDASFAVVEGTFGLDRNNVHVQPTVIGGPMTYPGPPEVGHYYPSAGRMPGYGRLEIEPPKNRQLPPQAESYQRSWTAQSAPPLLQIPSNPPPVIVAPQFNGSGQHKRPGARRGGQGGQRP
jgi:hypothetical protein